MFSFVANSNYSQLVGQPRILVTMCMWIETVAIILLIIYTPAVIMATISSRQAGIAWRTMWQDARWFYVAWLFLVCIAVLTE